MFCSVPRASLILVAAGTLWFCAKPPTSWRTAVLRFENLTPDNATDWIGRAVSEEVAGQLEGTRHNAIIPFTTIHQFDSDTESRRVGAPGVSTERQGALAAGANRIVTGFYSFRRNQLTITAVEEDANTREQTLNFTVGGATDDILHLTDEIARRIDEEALPPITGSARALRSYVLGLESSPDESKSLFEEAVRLDPDLGKPYVAMARKVLAASNMDAFNSILAAVRARGNGVRAVDRATLNLEEARLHAEWPARIDALAALVRLMPADPMHLRELATAELEANRYTEAADHFRKLSGLVPASADPVNQLGYALMYTGDEAGALKSFDAYRRALPGDANSFDSLGDAQFFFNHFQQAASLYLGANAANPAQLEGGEPLKAAWARMMLNNAKDASALLDIYREERNKAHDSLAPYRVAQIWRIMGKRDESARILEAYAETGSQVVRDTARAQLAWWRFLDGNGAAPDRASAVGQAVIAIAKRDFRAAAPLFRRLAAESSPNEWWTRAVYARVLSESGQAREALRYLKFTPIPQPNRGVSFDELWYPWILNARRRSSLAE